MQKDIILRGCSEVVNDNMETFKCNPSPCSKLNTYNWAYDLPQGLIPYDVVEVRFKNTRKGFYRNVNGLEIKQGDIVAVEASPGHDIGIVSLVGEQVRQQIKRYKVRTENGDYRKLYRKAKQTDIDKWYESISLEESTMLKARKISDSLNLNMKIGDVEYQGDRSKAIFYYIADERVDFRELIKVLAEEFRVRIEMKQIGARQEAGRIGGIGPCGRELCCSTWINNFVSVSTNAARYQDLSLNPQKLAGQCGKLKCCLNYELDAYLDAQKDFPDTNIVLETTEGPAYHQKTDVFRRVMWYALNKNEQTNFIALSVENVFETIESNKKGIKVKLDSEELKPQGAVPVIEELDYANVVGQDSLTRFDDKKKKDKQQFQKNRPNKPNSANNRQNNPENANRPNNPGGANRPKFQNNPNRQNKQNNQQKPNENKA
ncbi:MAG TPA: regulatory iron-sulfur-containing complex subunit RicT [Bacteroidales bacterium]